MTKVKMLLREEWEALLAKSGQQEQRIRELESKLSDLVAYCKDGYGDHEAAEIINAEKALEPPR